MSELDSVKCIGVLQPITSRLKYRCIACGGTGWKETGFAFGTNVGTGYRCIRCCGTGYVWMDAPPKDAA